MVGFVVAAFLLGVLLGLVVGVALVLHEVEELSDHEWDLVLWEREEDHQDADREVLELFSKETG